MTTPYPLNQFAPNYQQGMQQPPPLTVGFEDRPFEYVYNPPNGQLTANQLIDPDAVAINTDADFWMAGWYISLFTGAFQIKLTDSAGYQLSDGLINSAAISLVASDPTVFSRLTRSQREERSRSPFKTFLEIPTPYRLCSRVGKDSGFSNELIVWPPARRWSAPEAFCWRFSGPVAP